MKNCEKLVLTAKELVQALWAWRGTGFLCGCQWAFDGINRHGSLFHGPIDRLASRATDSVPIPSRDACHPWRIRIDLLMIAREDVNLSGTKQQCLRRASNRRAACHGVTILETNMLDLLAISRQNEAIPGGETAPTYGQ